MDRTSMNREDPLPQTASPTSRQPGPADEVRAAELAKAIDLSATFGISEFGEGRRRDVARTLDTALQVLRASGARHAADDMSDAVATLSRATWRRHAPGDPDDGGGGAKPRERGGKRGLGGLIGRLTRNWGPAGDGGGSSEEEGAEPELVTPELVERAAVALKLRQASLLKESNVLSSLLEDIQGEASDLKLLTLAATMRADAHPAREAELRSRTSQLQASLILTEQAQAALAMVLNADRSMAGALSEVTEHVVPVWRKMASAARDEASWEDGTRRPEESRGDGAELSALERPLLELERAERESSEATEAATDILLTTRGGS